MKPITLAEKLERENYVIRPYECSFCGKRLSQDQVHWIGTGCCPVCYECYRHYTSRKTKIKLVYGGKR